MGWGEEKNMWQEVLVGAAVLFFGVPMMVGLVGMYGHLWFLAGRWLWDQVEDWRFRCYMKSLEAKKR